MEEDGQIFKGFLPDQTPLDPNQFSAPWDVAFEVLAFIIILSFIIERVLSLLFESRAFLKYRKKQLELDMSPHKEMIAFLLSALTCWLYDIDLVAILMSHAYTSVFGILLTAGIVAGGSKGAVKLFREILGFKSGAYKDYEEFKKKYALQKSQPKLTPTADSETIIQPPPQ